MNDVFLDLGIITIEWYSVFIFLGIIVGGFFVLRESRRWRIKEDFIINLIFYAIPIGLIGARLYYVAFNWSYYGSNLIDIVKVWEGGLAIHGGIIAGLLWIIFYTKKYDVNTFRTLDIIVVGVIIGQAIGRWGNFFNSEAYGPVTTLENLQSLFIPKFITDGMYINGAYHHPTFLYESLWCVLGFIILLIFRRRKYTKIGQTAGLYMMWYSLGRFFIESLRTDSLMLGNIKVAQLISIILFIIGLLIMITKGSGSKFENKYNDIENIDHVDF